jgi:hypothetical protein
MQNSAGVFMNAKQQGRLQQPTTSIMHEVCRSKHADMGRGVLSSPGQTMQLAALSCSPCGPASMDRPSSPTLVGTGGNVSPTSVVVHGPTAIGARAGGTRPSMHGPSCMPATSTMPTSIMNKVLDIPQV